VSILDRRVELAGEWDELVDHVRTLAGYENFLKAPGLQQLLPAAAEGPIVVINVSQRRCDALIVARDGVQVLELRQVSAESVAGQVRGYVDGLQHAEDAEMASDSRVRAGRAAEPAALADEAVQRARHAREQVLSTVLEWLWNEIAGPVLEFLRIDPPAELVEPSPRLWWCPTGPLTLLPLHAAGCHTDEGKKHKDTVIDRVVTSYTPTLRALLDARRPRSRTARAGVMPAPAAGPAVPGDADGRMLIVALPRTPGQVPLPSVVRERQMLTEMFPGRYTLLEGPSATWETVRAELPRHLWAHFCCHADQNISDPSLGGILLHDRALTIADIADAQHSGEFAFLSACKTATGGITLPDEAISLVAALHYTGYRHVIGTLWSVFDRATAEVAGAVYADLISEGAFDPSRAARALHKAVRRLRDTGRPLSHWTPFTHTGP
jgi:hypothetical protein